MTLKYKMRWLIVMCAARLAGAPLPPLFQKIASEVAVLAFKEYLKSTMSGDGIGNLFFLRGMIPPDFNPEEHSGKFQGDIYLDDLAIDDMVNQYAMRSSFLAPYSMWANNTVVWQFNDGDFDEEQQAAILEAIYLIQNKTCIRFRQRKPNERSYVNVSGNITGCYAVVGYNPVRGMHVLNLAAHPPGMGCLRLATIVHEWMHILGFYHMHSTHDRDEYVKIVEENLEPGTEPYFEIYDSEQVSNLGIEYDYLSCLQYSPYAFSANGNATIVPLKEVEGKMGQRDYVTDSDWLRINRRYDCPGAWDEPPDKDAEHKTDQKQKETKNEKK